jgi:F0F1-type ATP synthase assembly protein I
MKNDNEGKGGRTPAIKGAKYMSLGFEMALPIVLLMYVGYRLDAWLGSKPWLFLLGAFLGIAVGFYSMFKRVGVIGRRNGDR